MQAYLNALHAGRLDDAYALLSTDYQRAHDRTSFERALSPSDRTAQAARLRNAKVTLAAEIDVGDGETIPLVREHGDWVFARDPLDFYPQRTPQETLRSFIRAVEHKRYEVVLRFVPERYRATITADKLRERWEGEKRPELTQQLEAIRSHLAGPFDPGTTDDEARLTLGERKQARLVREDGVWKVEALE